MKIGKSKVGVGVAAIVASLVSGKAAVAQTPEAPAGDQLEEITVSSSRLRISGYDAPTPVSVISEEEIQKAAPVTISDYVNQLPALAGSRSPRTTKGGIADGFAGGNYLNLRNLGTPRTLVLLDGRRFTPSTLNGAVDVNILPSPLISRVEVVTGGASAAWGSDAVAGVVNFALNKEFEGFKGGLSGGEATAGDAENIAADLSFGSGFAGGRGHVLLSAQYNDVGEARHVDRDWWKAYKVFGNPAASAAGVPVNLFQPYVTQFETPGGVVTAGPLAGYYFDANGALAGTNFSMVNRSGIYGFGDPARYWLMADQSRNNFLSTPLEQQSAFGRVSFDVTDSVTLFAEASYGEAESNARIASYNRPANLTLQIDNFYIPAAVRQAMVAAGQTSITIGKEYANMGTINSRQMRDNLRVLGGVEGSFGENWKWDVSYQHGKATTELRVEEMARVPTFTLATDAVANPANPSQPICRSTLTNPTNGCVPMNPLGTAALSSAQLAYVVGMPTQDIDYEQNVFAANIAGDLLTLPAGPLSAAAGLEYREEEAVAFADAISKANGFWAGNFKDFSGKYDVKEAYLELGAPVLADSALGSLDLNVASRFTDYSTSGNVTTWKAGFLYEPIESVVLRVTRSRDIRAPNLQDLYTPGVVTNQEVADPTRGNTTVRMTQTLSGNPELDPEKADTMLVGLVLAPTFAPKLKGSIDYYDIKIDGAIATNSSQFIVNRCFAGLTTFCSAITRDATGTITAVNLRPFNALEERAKGVDVELSYTTPVAGGDLDLRLLTNYIQTLEIITPTTTINRAGEAGNNVGAAEGTPRWRSVATVTYGRDPWAFQLKGRYIGKAKVDDAWDSVIVGGIARPGIDDNQVPSVFYLDVYASFKLTGLGDFLSDGEIFIASDNVLDKDPPMIPLQDNSNTVASGTNPFLYDVLGRTIRAGVRFSF